MYIVHNTKQALSYMNHVQKILTKSGNDDVQLKLDIDSINVLIDVLGKKYSKDTRRDSKKERNYHVALRRMLGESVKSISEDYDIAESRVRQLSIEFDKIMMHPIVIKMIKQTLGEQYDC